MSASFRQKALSILKYSTFPLLPLLQLSRFHSHGLVTVSAMAFSSHNSNLPFAHSTGNCCQSFVSKSNTKIFKDTFFVKEGTITTPSSPFAKFLTVLQESKVCTFVPLSACLGFIAKISTTCIITFQLKRLYFLIKTLLSFRLF